MYQTLISVIIPAYNNANTIADAVRSIQLQTYKNLEIIVVDDGSTDGTGDIVRTLAHKDSRISYYRMTTPDPYRVNRLGVNINAGYASRNFGVEKAAGTIITFQDADDISYANRIDVQYCLLEQYGAIHAVVGNRTFRDGDEKLAGTTLSIEEKTFSVLDFDAIAAIVRENPPVPRWLRDPASYRAVNTIPIRMLKRLGRALLWRDVAPYPGSGNAAMVRREVFEQVQFRPLWERTRPSRKGRGADMDFNYAVAETFGKSIVVQAPLYVWRR